MWLTTYYTPSKAHTISWEILLLAEMSTMKIYTQINAHCNFYLSKNC